MPNSGHLSLRHEATPLGALVPPSQRAMRTHHSVRSGVGGSFPRPPPPVPKENRQRLPAACPRDGRWEEGECPTPDTPHGGTRRPPRAPSDRPHNVRSQLTGACAERMVPGPHARTPPRPRKMGSGLRPPPPRTGDRGRESVQSRTPLTEARGATTRCPCTTPTQRDASSQERAL